MSGARHGVLRGVAVAHDAHVLRRPGEAAGRRVGATASGEVSAREAPAAPGEVGAANMLEWASGQASGAADGYREGFSEGLRKGLDEGRASGLAQGLEEGRAEGLARAKQEAELREQAARVAHAQQTDRFAQWLGGLAAGLESRLTAYARSAEEDMIAICHRALCRVFGETAAHRDGAVLSVRQAIAEYCSVDVASTLAALLTVRVHPADVAYLEADVELAQAIQRHGVQRVTWVGDEQVTLGGCLVDSVHGRLDSRLETQLAALTALLLRNMTPDAPENA